jgi:hypothetical protein
MVLDSYRNLATTTVKGLVEKASAAELAAFAGADVYPDMDGIDTMLDDLNKVISTSSTPYTILASDLEGTLVLLSSRSATATGSIILPSAATLSASHRTRVIIKDSGGNAGSNSQTISTTSGETIDGGLYAVLNSDYKSITLVTDGSDWFIV